MNVGKLKNDIVNSFTDPEFRLSDLMKEVAYCDDHIRRIFKKETGCPPNAYLQKLRIDYAKNILANNAVMNYKIEEIAMISGYYDSRYFHRVFKKETGMTPKQYFAVQRNAL